MPPDRIRLTVSRAAIGPLFITDGGGRTALPALASYGTQLVWELDFSEFPTGRLPVGTKLFLNFIMKITIRLLRTILYSVRLLKGILLKKFPVSEDVKRNGENDRVGYLQVLLLQRGGRIPVQEPPGEELLWSGDMPCAQVFHLPHLQGHGGLRPHPEVIFKIHYPLS